MMKRLLVFPLCATAAFVITSRGNNKYHCNDVCGYFVILTKSEEERQFIKQQSKKFLWFSPIISDKKHHDVFVFTLSFYLSRLLFS
jgi:hypothetical protein